MDYDQDRYTIWGVVTGRSNSDHTRIKVLGFKIGSRWEYNQTSILEVFEPQGFVFGPSFFLRNLGFSIGELIQIEAIPNANSDGREDHDAWVLRYQESPRKEGWKLFETALQIEIEGRLSLKGHVDLGFHDSESFYMLSKGNIYGQIIFKDNLLMPKSNETEVWQASEVSICTFDGSSFFREKPKLPPRKIDSASDDYLIKWLAKELKQQNSPGQAEFEKHPGLRQAILEMIPILDEAVSEARIKRVQSAIIKFEHRFAELSRFLENSPTFKEEYERYLDKQKLEVQEKFEAKLKSENLELNRIEQNKVEIQKKIDDLLVRNAELRTEQEFLISNRDKIVTEMKLLIHSGLGEPSSSVVNQRLNQQFFEVSAHQNDALPKFESPELFAASFRSKLFKNGMTVKKQLSQGMPSFLRKHNAILIPDIRFATCFADASNNATVVIQHVEPDWLKFESCWNAGLAKILAEAIENPSRLHFLVLEDINLASPECWGKPLFSVQAGQRSKFPIISCGWPRNFWLFGTKIRSKEPQSIGLPIFQSTFQTWGGIKETFLTEQKAEHENQPQGFLGFEDLMVNWDLEDMEMPQGNAIELYFDVTNDD